MAAHVTEAPPQPPQAHPRVPAWLLRVWNSWATRSLAVGAGATALDLVIGTSLLTFFHMSTRPSAMVGSIVGSTFTYFANRYFAFRDHNPKLASSAVKFIIVTAVSSLIHGQVVVWLRDHFGVPYVPAKMIADVAVFTFGQLLLLRYVVFPKAKVPAVAVPSAQAK